MAATALAVDNLLLAIGITTPLRFLTEADTTVETRIIRQGPQIASSSTLTGRAWFEPAVDIGDIVQEGDVAGWLHDLERPLAAPEVLRFRDGGIVLSRRLHTHSHAGDSLFNVAELVR